MKARSRKLNVRGVVGRSGGRVVERAGCWVSCKWDSIELVGKSDGERGC